MADDRPSARGTDRSSRPNLDPNFSAKIVRIGLPGPQIFFACGALIRKARCARGSPGDPPPGQAPPSPPSRWSPSQEGYRSP